MLFRSVQALILVAHTGQAVFTAPATHFSVQVPVSYTHLIILSQCRVRHGILVQRLLLGIRQLGGGSFCGLLADPVSYTHLDVYKRQEEGWRYVDENRFEWRLEVEEDLTAVKQAAKNRNTEEAVSYTHLDVYKRQLLMIPSIMP